MPAWQLLAILLWRLAESERLQVVHGYDREVPAKVQADNVFS